MHVVEVQGLPKVELCRLSTSDAWVEQVPTLVQLPGVGVLTAMFLLAAIGDISRFPSAKQLVGYVRTLLIRNLGGCRILAVRFFMRSGERLASLTLLLHDLRWLCLLDAVRRAQHGCAYSRQCLERS